MPKSSTAFRTISEVAGELNLPQHVLRFWESKFTAIKPMKRGGGRRYYRPDDIHILRRIQGLLYDDGYTIKGVQKLFREGGGSGLKKPKATGGKAATKKASAGDDKSRQELNSILDELQEIRQLASG